MRKFQFQKSQVQWSLKIAIRNSLRKFFFFKPFLTPFPMPAMEGTKFVCQKKHICYILQNREFSHWEPNILPNIRQIKMGCRPYYV